MFYVKAVRWWVNPEKTQGLFIGAVARGEQDVSHTGIGWLKDSKQYFRQ
jgi:hypothetical protein